MNMRKILSVLLCVAMLFSFVALASCDESYVEGGVTTEGTDTSTPEPDDITTTSPSDETTAPEDTTTAVTEDTATGEKTDSTTTNPQAGPVEPNKMTFDECVKLANDYVSSLFGETVNGFMPDFLSDIKIENGGNIKLYVDSVSLLGNSLIEYPLSLNNSYIMSQNGLFTSGSLKAEEEIGYELYITPDGAIYVRFPQYDNAHYVKLDTAELLGMIGGMLPSDEDLVPTPWALDETAPETEDTSDMMASLDGLLALLDGFMSGELQVIASAEAVADETVNITVIGNELQNVRKLTVKYKLAEFISAELPVNEFEVTYYVYGNQSVRAEYKVMYESQQIAIFVNMLESDGKTSFDGGINASAGGTEQSIITFNGEKLEASAKITFALNENATDTLGGIMMSLGYKKLQSENRQALEYSIGLGASGLGGLIFNIPVTLELIDNADGSQKLSFKIDTVSAGIATQFADVRLGFEMNILSDAGVENFELPMFTDENTISVTDPADFKYLEAYIMGLDEKYPSIRRTIENILEQFGFVFEDQGIPSGTYTNGTASYVFEGNEVTLKVSVLSIKGTYYIDGETIIFNFGEGNSMNGEYYFANLGDSIIIGNAEFTKQ